MDNIYNNKVEQQEPQKIDNQRESIKNIRMNAVKNILNVNKKNLLRNGLLKIP